MKTIDKDKLKEVLASHGLWLRGDSRGVRADLSDTDLSGVDLEDANLEDANLEDANLVRANLVRANLVRANLEDANLEDANLPYFSIVPEEGPFIGWKKVRYGVVLKLEILGRRTSSLVGRKCRTDKALVLEAFGENSGDKVFYSIHNHSFTYEVGKVVEVDNFDDNIRVECTTGIHFFITRREAEMYS